MVKRQNLLKELGARAKQKAEESEGSKGASNAFESRLSTVAEVTSGRRREVNQIFVEPERCRMWRRHNRLYEHLSADNCSDLIDRISAEGQQIPAIVRRIPSDESFEFEVIAGARRHYAVSYIRNELGRTDVLYLVEPRVLTDQEAFSLSDSENRARRDISDYERGRDYDTALNEFYGGNVTRMSESIGMKRTTLSAYLQVAQLPEEIVAAYGDLHQLPVRHGQALMPKLKNEEVRKAVLAEALEIAALQQEAMRVSNQWAMTGADVLKRFEIAAGAKRRPKAKPSGQEEISDAVGNPILLAERGRKYLTVRIPISQTENRKAVLDAMRKIL